MVVTDRFHCTTKKKQLHPKISTKCTSIEVLVVFECRENLIHFNISELPNSHHYKGNRSYRCRKVCELIMWFSNEISMLGLCKFDPFIRVYFSTIVLCAFQILHNDCITRMILYLIIFMLLWATSNHFKWWLMLYCMHFPNSIKFSYTYFHQTSNKSGTSESSKIVDHLDVVGAAAPTISAFPT